MKYPVEKLSIINFQVIALLISFAYGYGGLIQKELSIYGAESTNYNLYWAFVLLGFCIPTVQILSSLFLSLHLYYEKEESIWWVWSNIISIIICIIFLSVVPSLLYPKVF